MPPKVCANSSCRIPDRGRKKNQLRTAAGSWKLKVIFSHITRIHILVVKFYPGPYKAWDILFWTKAVDRLTDRLTLPCLSQTTSTAKTDGCGKFLLCSGLVLEQQSKTWNRGEFMYSPSQAHRHHPYRFHLPVHQHALLLFCQTNRHKNTGQWSDLASLKGLESLFPAQTPWVGLVSFCWWGKLWLCLKIEVYVTT